MHELMAAANKEELIRLSRVQFNTGMRFNEMVSLNYFTNIDFENKLIRITKTYDTTNRIFTPPKNDDSRNININDETVGIIKDQIDYDTLKMLRFRLDRDEPLLFRNRRGTPVDIRDINRNLKRYAVNDRNISTHFYHAYD